MSKQSSNNAAAVSAGGCGKLAMYGVLAAIALVVALGAGALMSTYFLADQAIAKPVQSLVKGIGIGATPEIRPDPVTIVRSINDLAQLQTASFQMEKIVTAKRGEDSILGLFEDSLIFVAVGEVTAGIDLAKLTPNDIQAADFETVTIRLPEAEVFIATLDNGKSYVADRDTGLLATTDPQMETQVRQVAEEEILAAALEENILGIAEENAQTVLDGFLRSLGFTNVVFVEGAMPAPVEFGDPEVPKGFILTPMAP